MNCKECGYKMELRYNVEHPFDFIIYICPHCKHTKKFNKEEILIATLEFIKEEC